MIELVKYFKILFLSAKISRQRLKDFAADHLTRLIANNPGAIFAILITDTTAALNAYVGNLEQESTAVSNQEGDTLGMDESKAALLLNISDNEKQVAYTYRNDNVKYKKFYPGGIMEYNDADLPTLETISGRYKGTLATNAADFTTDFVDAFNAAQQKFVDDRGTQTVSFSAVSTERGDIVSSKAKLAFQLTKNLLTIALQYLGQEEKAPVYFNQAILNAAFKESIIKVDAILNPLETQNAFDSSTIPTLNFKLTVEGAGSVFAGYAKDAVTPIDVHTGKEGNASAPIFFTSGDAGFTLDNFYLNVTSASGTTLRYILEKV